MKIPSRYDMTDEEHKGGFGKATVYYDSHLERKIIIKEVLNSKDKDRLLNEITALQKIKSKHVVEVFDAIQDQEGNLALIEEYLPGDDLEGMVETDPQLYCKILFQIASGIKDLHESGIVHRDLNPNNMKFDAEKYMKIFDFGLAKHEELPASTIGLVGTIGFMAPELYLSPPNIDKPIDVFAFGVIAFCLASGQLPSSCKSKPPKKNYVPLNKYLELPEKLSKIISSCLDLTPENRPEIVEIYDELRNQLLFNQHRAVFIVNGEKYELNEKSKRVRINRAKTDYISITYDGYRFVLSEAEGDVFVNSEKVEGRVFISGSCVIILGHPSLGMKRSFVPLDVNHPEVTI